LDVFGLLKSPPKPVTTSTQTAPASLVSLIYQPKISKYSPARIECRMPASRHDFLLKRQSTLLKRTYHGLFNALSKIFHLSAARIIEVIMKASRSAQAVFSILSIPLPA
jgi:hypothetical protein